jgi:hypothetical protein
MMGKLNKRSVSESNAFSSTPEGDKWHHNIMAYLGYVNIDYAALASVRLYDMVDPTTSYSIKKVDGLALGVLGIASTS